MNRRRIAVIAYHSSPLAEPGRGDAGGMSVYIRELASALSAYGIATDVFTRASSEGRCTRKINGRVRVISIEAGPLRALSKDRLPRYLPSFVAGVRAFVLGQRLSYDAVHSHYWQSGLAAHQLSAAWNVPLVHSQHTLALVKNRFLAPGDVPESQTRLSGERRVMAHADVLIASTEQELQDLACLYGVSHDRIKMIHPGVDHRLFRPGERRRARELLGIGDERVLVYVGRIQPLKGLDLALRALARLRDTDASLLVVGGASGAGGERELEALNKLAADLGVADRVRFVGPQRHSRLPLFYRAAEVAVVTSYSESFGFCALEASACGTPVVGTAVGGLSHVVRDGTSGFLVPDRDPDGFAARVRALLDDDELARRFAREAIASSRRFSWPTAAGATRELYECLIETRLPEACVC